MTKAGIRTCGLHSQNHANWLLSTDKCSALKQKYKIRQVLGAFKIDRFCFMMDQVIYQKKKKRYNIKKRVTF